MTNGDRSGTTRTFYSMRGFHVGFGVVLTAVGVGMVVLGAVASAHPHIHFFQADGGESFPDIFGLIVLGILCAWIAVRMIRVEVRISAEKVTIRSYLRTRTVDASEIRAVSLQPAAGSSGPRWLPRVEVAGGKDFWIWSFDCGPANKPPKPDKAATIQEIGALLGVETADPGAHPGLRHGYGSDGSPSPEADLIDGGAEGGNVPT
jgi:hypothetical protein